MNIPSALLAQIDEVITHYPVSRRSASLGRKPGFTATNALTISPAIGSGLPITPASATAGCYISALSTSNGPIRWPEDLITSSARPTNQ